MTAKAEWMQSCNPLAAGSAAVPIDIIIIVIGPMRPLVLPSMDFISFIGLSS